MLISDLDFRPAINSPGNEYAVMPRLHVTVWRHADNTYSIMQYRRRGGPLNWRKVEELAAQCVIYELINRGKQSSP